MTISYTLQPDPFWYFSDLTGKPLAGGQLFSYSSLNPTQFKPIYQDAAGINQWPNPVLFDETGTAGPFYFKLDSTDPDDLYFLQIFDSNGNLVRQINQYPISGGSGGGTINTVQKISNIFVNSSFINNIGSTTAQPIVDQTFLAPSSHSGLFYPDIKFIKGAVSSSVDTISFLSFGIGTNPISPDFAPAYYLNYTCTNTPSGETFKGYRIPITPFVNTIANQIFTITLQARSNGSGANQINIQLRQFFGSGGSPSADVVTNLTATPITLTTSFALYSVTFTVPTVVGKTLSNSNDDGTYLEILIPTGQSCNIDIAKPSLYSGSTFPLTFYETVEEIEAQLETPRTGDLKISSNTFSYGSVQAGWVPLNDGTIGNSSSNSTCRANSDTWLLYDQLWNGTTASNCPLFDSSSVSVVKGGSSLSDWNANRQLTLGKTVGRVLANRSPNTTIVQSYTSNFSTNLLTVASTAGFLTGYPISFTTAAPAPLSVGINYYVIVVSGTTLKIALSAEAAIANSPILITTNVSGNIQTPPAYNLCQFQGENVHQDTIAEMPAHNHPGSDFPHSSGSLAGGGIASVTLAAGSLPVNVASQGGNVPHNNVQPTVFYNMSIKL